MSRGDLLHESDIRPLTHPAAPGKPEPRGADFVLDLEMGFDFTTFEFTINNNTFTSPSAPVLLQILSGKQRAQDLLPAGNVYTLPRNKTIEINLIGGNAVGGPVSS